MTTPVLAIRDLEISYQTDSGPTVALQDIDLTVLSGEIVGVVGESGCGKSSLAASVLRLLPANGEITAGDIRVQGEDVRTAARAHLRAMRGTRVAMIFQDPFTSLNPSFTIGRQMLDVQRAHSARRIPREVLRRRACTLLEDVGLPDARAQLDRYPHEFSGGMRQRILIAMALSLEPALLIADEPTSALDVTLAAQILELLRDLRERHGTAILLISHDLGVIAEICDRVMVMYAGRLMEEGSVPAVFHDPKHPYTRALLHAVPTIERRSEVLESIPGRVPTLTGRPSECVFAARCPYAQDACLEGEPPLVFADGQRVRCRRFDASSNYAQSTSPQRVTQRD